MTCFADNFAFELFLARVAVDTKLRHQFIESPESTMSLNGIEAHGPIIVSFREDLHFPAFDTIDGSVEITLPINSSSIQVQQLPATSKDELLVASGPFNQAVITEVENVQAVTSLEVGVGVTVEAEESSAISTASSVSEVVQESASAQLSADVEVGVMVLID